MEPQNRPAVKMEWIPISEETYPQVAKIYAEGLETKIATFETTVPDWEYWNASHHQFARISLQEKGKLLGWASLSPVSKRKVYNGVAEVSIYVASHARGKGVGKKLLGKLIEISEEHNIWTLQSGIFKDNEASIQLHKNCGFRVIGYREKVGKLDGKWLDNVLLERRSKVIGI